MRQPLAALLMIHLTASHLRSVHSLRRVVSRWLRGSFLALAVAMVVTSSGNGLTLHVTSAAAEEPGMFSKLNPMNWSIPKPTWKMPEFFVPKSDQDRIVERKDGLMTDVKKTASNSWQKTKETFNPARLNPMNLFAGPTPSTTTPAKDDSPGFFQSMFSSPSEPEERVANVNDFLSQERPK